MKILRVILITVLLAALSTPASAGMLTLGAKASIYNPPEAGASPSLMYGFMLDYDINAVFHARAGAHYTSYTANDVDYTLMPITLDILAHLMPGNNVDPYLGVGVGYYSKTIDGEESSHTGGQAIAGIKFNLGGFSAAFEATYMVPDLAKSEEGSFAWGGWASGSTYVYVPF